MIHRVDYLGRGRIQNIGWGQAWTQAWRRARQGREAYARIVSVMCTLFFEGGIGLLPDVGTIVARAEYGCTC